ncbi:MAG: septal ring lytic transglycosylase RlpA family protein [Bacteroidetes bacterium]|nr:septal ring lytic transglycosylase RlpA family protein [Bacteroidota bacterium]
MQKYPLLFLLVCAFIGASKAQQDSAEKCVASFYADKFIGRKCSSGEVFSQDKFTAAHKTLKFGTKVKVTNLKNDSSVIVVINDRMPPHSKRCIDLSKAGAKRLNFIAKGVTKVKVEILKDSLP